MAKSLSERIARAPEPFDPKFAEAALKTLSAKTTVPTAAAPLLTGAFGCAPYLARLGRRFPEDLGRILAEPPEDSLAGALAEMDAAAQADTPEALDAVLRKAKARIHLLTALSDLGGVWELEQVTGALTRTADAALSAALSAHARFLGAEDGRAPGYFFVALGKQGSGELNYSSDIDVAAFYDPELCEQDDPGKFHVRLTRRIVTSIGGQTQDGYVFRVDLRLRPDPASTPVALSTDAATRYYESTALTWERAAWIKARVAAGDAQAGEDFLGAVMPFVWRRTMDFAAVDEMAAILQQIADAGDSRQDDAAGFDLKRGPGGIRHIEFFAQIQQLLWGGRDETLRCQPTLEALEALVKAEHVGPQDARTLTGVYRRLRDVEHRLQMIEDQQTQEAPEDPQARTRLAMLSGSPSLETFDAELLEITGAACTICAGLFADSPPSSTALVFDGPDPGVAAERRLRELGFEDPAAAWAIFGSWVGGQPRAMRSDRARTLARKLASRIAEEIGAAPSPDASLARFDDFVRALPAGVQILSMLDREPRLLTDLVDMLSLSPRLARALSERPDGLEVFLAFDPEELAPGAIGARIGEEIAGADDLEDALDRARRLTRETMVLIGMTVLRGDQDAGRVSAFYSALAEALIRALLPPVQKDLARRYGDIDGDFAVVAFGSFGACEMTVRSDTDIVMVYDAAPDAASDGERSADAETYFGRLAQRFVSALSAPTAEGSLFNIDLALRPHGSAGPVASRVSAYERYYESEAWTWEMMALTRARVVAGPPEFAAKIEALIREVLTRPRDRAATARDIADMRARLEREKPPQGFWDLVQSPGALTDVRFAVQYLQLVCASEHPDVLAGGTRASIAALAKAGALDTQEARALDASAELHLDLAQLFALAVDGPFDPAAAPPRLKARLARAGGVDSFSELESRVRHVRAAARTVFETKVLC